MKFLIIGEQCLDVFVYGKCDRLSPEAPVPVFTPITETVNRGMAGNVVENLKALKKKYGGKFQVDEWVCEEEMIKKRYVDKKSNHIFLRVDFPDTCPKIVFTDKVIKKLKSADIIIVSDYNKGFLTDDDMFKIAEFSKQGSKIFVDTKRKLTRDLMVHLDYLKLNESESNQLDPQILFYNRKIITTLGGKGAQYMNKKYLVEEVETIDVSGAGDTFLAALAYQYAKTKSIPKSIIFANKMASLVVKKRGVSTI